MSTPPSAQAVKLTGCQRFLSLLCSQYRSVLAQTAAVAMACH